MVNYNAFYFPDDVMALLFCCFAIFLAFRIGRSGKFYFNFFLAVSFIHLIALLFGLVVTGGMDARRYYSTALQMTPDGWLSSFGQGTTFINFFTYPIVHLFQLSYSGGYFFYACFGLYGYYFILKSIIFLIKKYSLLYKKYYFYVLLLPGIHIWNIAIGKDSLMFFSIALFFAGILMDKWLWIIIGGALICIIRSPVFALLAAGLVFGNILFNKKITIFQKIIIVMISIGAFILLLPLLQARLGLDNVDYDSINDNIDQRLLANQFGGSSVDMTNAPFVAKLFGFLFRPLFFDARSATMIYSSLENVVWLTLVISVLKNFKQYIFNSRYSALYLALFLSFLFPVLAESSILTNLGIAVRMKTMYFTPLVLLFFLSRDYELRKKLLKKKITKLKKGRLRIQLKESMGN
jgi:hypothetical protein